MADTKPTKATPAAKQQAAAAAAPASPETAGTTRLDEHVDAPSVTAPGDGPADTTDPTEVATSVTPDKAAAAQDGHLTVNAAVPAKQPAAAAPSRRSSKSKDRIEEYDAVRPNGEKVRVRRNIETGATELI